jgi:hypothetical protein
MLISMSLELLAESEVVGRDRIKVGDLEFRVAGWDSKNRRLMLAPIRTGPGDDVHPND